MDYKTLVIVSGIALILCIILMIAFYIYISKAVRKSHPNLIYQAQAVILMMLALGFAIGMLLSSFMNAYTKMIFLTLINENHFVV